MFEEAAFVSKGLLADGALEFLLVGLPLFIPKRPFADGALDSGLLEEPNPETPVVLGDLPLGASLFAVIQKNCLEN